MREIPGPGSFLCPNLLPAQQPRTPGQCGCRRQKAKQAPEGTKPPQQTWGLRHRCQALRTTLCSTTKGLPSARTRLHLAWPRFLSLYFIAHPKFNHSLHGAWSGQRLPLWDARTESQPPPPPHHLPHNTQSCLGLLGGVPSHKICPVSSGSHKTWHHPPNRCFLNTVFRRHSDSTSNIKATPSHSFWRNKAWL